MGWSNIFSSSSLVAILIRNCHRFWSQNLHNNNPVSDRQTMTNRSNTCVCTRKISPYKPWTHTHLPIRINVMHSILSNPPSTQLSFELAKCAIKHQYNISIFQPYKLNLLVMFLLHLNLILFQSLSSNDSSFLQGFWLIQSAWNDIQFISSICWGLVSWYLQLNCY